MRLLTMAFLLMAASSAACHAIKVPENQHAEVRGQEEQLLPLTTRWNYSFNDEFARRKNARIVPHSVVTSDGVTVMESSGLFAVRTADGSPLWNRTLPLAPARVGQSPLQIIDLAAVPAEGDGPTSILVLVCGTESWYFTGGTLTSISSTTGAIQWETQLSIDLIPQSWVEFFSAGTRALTAVSSKTVLMQLGNGKAATRTMYQVDTTTGKLSVAPWNKNITVTVHPVVSKGLAVLAPFGGDYLRCTNDGAGEKHPKVSVVNVSSGTELWEVTLSAKLCATFSRFGAVSVFDVPNLGGGGAVVVGLGFKGVPTLAFDLLTSAPLWNMSDSFSEIYNNFLPIRKTGEVNLLPESGTWLMLYRFSTGHGPHFPKPSTWIWQPTLMNMLTGEVLLNSTLWPRKNALTGVGGECGYLYQQVIWSADLDCFVYMGHNCDPSNYDWVEAAACIDPETAAVRWFQNMSVLLQQGDSGSAGYLQAAPELSGFVASWQVYSPASKLPIRYIGFSGNNTARPTMSPGAWTPTPARRLPFPTPQPTPPPATPQPPTSPPTPIPPTPQPPTPAPTPAPTLFPPTSPCLSGLSQGFAVTLGFENASSCAELAVSFTTGNITFAASHGVSLLAFSACSSSTQPSFCIWGSSPLASAADTNWALRGLEGYEISNISWSNADATETLVLNFVTSDCCPDWGTSRSGCSQGDSNDMGGTCGELLRPSGGGSRLMAIFSPATSPTTTTTMATLGKEQRRQQDNDQNVPRSADEFSPPHQLNGCALRSGQNFGITLMFTTPDACTDFSQLSPPARDVSFSSQCTGIYRQGCITVSNLGALFGDWTLNVTGIRIAAMMWEKANRTVAPNLALEIDGTCCPRGKFSSGSLGPCYFGESSQMGGTCGSLYPLQLGQGLRPFDMGLTKIHYRAVTSNEDNNSNGAGQQPDRSSPIGK